MTGHPKHCLRQQGDQLHCTHCGKTWDVADIDPPQCVTEKERRNAVAQQWINRIRRNLEKGK